MGPGTRDTWVLCPWSRSVFFITTKMSIKFVVVKDQNNRPVRGAVIDNHILDTTRLHKNKVYSVNVFKNNQHVRGGKKVISLGRTSSTIDLNRLQHGKTYMFTA